MTFGLSAYTALVSLIEAVILGLSGQKVALNRKLSPIDLINLALNLASVLQLVAWGLLGLYLLWRSGFRAEPHRARALPLAPRPARRPRPRGGDRHAGSRSLRRRAGTGHRRGRRAVRTR